MTRLSKHYGVNIYFKRDDLTGLGRTGNKIRKLEYLFYEAKAKGADTIITCGGTQSNHARATAVLSRQLGLEPHLVLSGSEPTSKDGNLLLMKLLDAQIHWITPEKYSEKRDLIMEDLAEVLRTQGKVPYIIPLGGSNVTGILGYLNAGFEIYQQQMDMDTPFDYIFDAVGSGGTISGLILAKKIARWGTKIVGVNISRDAAYFRKIVKQLLDECIAMLEFDINIGVEDIEIVDGFVGPGYAIPTDEEIALIKMVAKLEGIFLEPVYTGKTYWALDSILKSREIPKGANVLFMHTGGIFGLFPYKDELFP
jgi:D-cysteine desulfhydrase